MKNNSIHKFMDEATWEGLLERKWVRKVLITTKTILSLHCPKCGKINLFAVSRFQCGKRGRVSFACECGTGLLEIVRKGCHAYSLHASCFMCETSHCLNLSGERIWNKKMLPIKCEHTGMELGYMGNKDEVLKAINEEEELFRELAAPSRWNDFYVNPKILYRVLDILGRMAERDQLSCDCGGVDMELETFPDRVELRCADCRAVGVVFAESFRDLQTLFKMDNIMLEADSRIYLDGSGQKKRTKVKNKEGTNNKTKAKNRFY